MAEVLLIDDNQEILEANASYLSRNGFGVTVADSGIKAIAVLSSREFDCIVLDILLPDLDGYAICKAARTVTSAPILFLSCLDEIDDKTRGLMLGGDDYMTKPYSLKELAARVQALVRRGGAGAFSIERDQRLIRAGARSVILSKKEFELFCLFYENPGVLFSKEALLKRLWGKDMANPHTVTVHIARLKKKIAFAEEQLGRIASAYGDGYRFEPVHKQGL